MPDISIDGPGPHKLAPLLVKAGLATSNSEAMPKSRSAVYVAGEKVTDPAKEWVFSAPVSVKLGRRWVKLKPLFKEADAAKIAGNHVGQEQDIAGDREVRQEPG